MHSSTVLIVEDEQIVALDLHDRLTELGYGVVGIVSTGRDAVEKARQCRPDVVLMDIRLEGKMDGIEAAEQIHAELGLPIVYLADFGDQRRVERVRLDSRSAYLLKPFDEREVGLAIDTAIRQTRQAREMANSVRWLGSILGGAADGVIATDALGKVQF